MVVDTDKLKKLIDAAWATYEHLSFAKKKLINVGGGAAAGALLGSISLGKDSKGKKRGYLLAGDDRTRSMALGALTGAMTGLHLPPKLAGARHGTPKHHALKKLASPKEYVNFLREFVSNDEVDDNSAMEYGRVLHKNRNLLESAYEHYNPQHHHFNWLWRPKTVPVQKLIYAFEKVEDKLPEDKRDGFRRVADKLVDNLNKKTSPFPIIPSYTYTPDEGGASQFGFMVF